MFTKLTEQLKANPKTIVFTEGTDPRIQRCCSKADCRRHSERNPAGQPGRSKADCCRCEI